MGRNARAVQEVAFSEIRRQLGYKCEWHVKILETVDRWYPSSKTCSVCQHIVDELRLDQRHWQCPKCGTCHDRDINAARNLLMEGLLQLAGCDDRYLVLAEEARSGHRNRAWVEQARHAGDPALAELVSRKLLPDGEPDPERPPATWPEPLDGLAQAECRLREALPLVTEGRRAAALSAAAGVDMAHHEESQIARHLLAGVRHGTYVECFADPARGGGFLTSLSAPAYCGSSLSKVSSAAIAASYFFSAASA